jgi:GntR family transcriptional regulator
MPDEASRNDAAEFDPDADPTRYIYDKLADYLGELIEKGRFRLHERFPGEQQLAKDYGVSLGTARHAIRLLQYRGLVKTLRSKGTFVAYDAQKGAIGGCDESARNPSHPSHAQFSLVNGHGYPSRRL